MRLTALTLAATLLAAPAFAQDAGNVGQPSRSVPQAGQTAGGPIDTPSGAGGRVDTTGTVARPTGEVGVPPGVGAVDSAKGGNAAEPSKPAPNLGNTSGGPAR